MIEPGMLLSMSLHTLKSAPEYLTGLAIVDGPHKHLDRANATFGNNVAAQR